METKTLNLQKTSSLEKKSILFIADKPEWAYHNIIKTWSLFLGNEYDCYIAFANDYLIRQKKFSFAEKLIINNINALRNKNKSYKIDSSRNFSYPVYKNPKVFDIKNQTFKPKKEFDIIIEMAYYFQYVSEFPFQAKHRLVGLYTDSYPHEGPTFDAKTGTELKNLERKTFFEKYLKKYSGILVGNTNLYDDYKVFTDKLIFANGIYRQNDFKENLNVGESETLTIGWTGNPTRSMKGFHEVIEPAVENVKKTGRKIILKTQFTGSYDSILQFYSDVDIVAIASEADTGPSLFAEAALCNVPAISTEIGFPKMVIENEKNGIFVHRDIQEMENAIISMYDNREKLKSFSKRIKQNYLSKLDNKISLENLSAFLHELESA